MTTSAIDVIIPVYNEEQGLREFHRRLTALPLKIHPIYIDNASTDSSLQILESFPDVTIIRHQRNEGYGASLRDGILASASERIVIIDADCEYPPESIPDLVRALDSHEIVYMSRFLGDQNSFMPFLKRFGNQLITGCFNILFSQNVTDLYTGSKAFRRSVVIDLPMHRDGFEHVLELAARVAKKGIKFHEIPVHFSPRQTGRSKMSHLSETLKYFYFLLYYCLTVPGKTCGKNP